MQLQEFNEQAYRQLLNSDYKFIELVGVTRPDEEVSEDYFKKPFDLKAHKEKPENSAHYVLEINDDEVRAMLRGEDTIKFYIN